MLLFGDITPSGKLAETWPLQLSDNPSYLNFPGEEGIVEYHEGIFAGYRYYEKKNMAVRFPFGHGLSYTDFSYSNLIVDKDTITDDGKITVTVDVKNTGTCFGKEVVQLYVGQKNCRSAIQGILLLQICLKQKPEEHSLQNSGKCLKAKIHQKMSLTKIKVNMMIKMQPRTTLWVQGLQRQQNA